MQTICQHRKPFKKAVQEKHKHFTQTHTRRQRGRRQGRAWQDRKGKESAQRLQNTEAAPENGKQQTANAEIGLLATRKQRKKPPSPPTAAAAAQQQKHKSQEKPMQATAAG